MKEILMWIYNNIIVSSYFIEMFTACLCGAVIGLERSRRQKDAGIRTHMIVALGSALIMIVSKLCLKMKIKANRLPLTQFSLRLTVKKQLTKSMRF